MSSLPRSAKWLFAAAAVAVAAALGGLLLLGLLRVRSPAGPQSVLTANPADESAQTVPSSLAPDSSRATTASTPAVPPAPESSAAPAVETPPAAPEDFDHIAVICRNEYPPRGEPNVMVEYRVGGGLTVTVKGPGTVSMHAEYGMPIAQKAVRLCGLDNRQLAEVQRFHEYQTYVDRHAHMQLLLENACLELADFVAPQAAAAQS